MEPPYWMAHAQLNVGVLIKKKRLGKGVQIAVSAVET